MRVQVPTGLLEILKIPGVGPRTVKQLHDELGQVHGPTSALYDALETAMGAHDKPLSIVISTQAPTSGDLLSLLIDYARMGGDLAQKVILFTADKAAPLDDPETWRQANPAMGDFLNVEEIKSAAEKAMRMPSFESAFRNLHLNQRVSAFAQLFSQSVWEAGGATPDTDAFEGGPVYGGRDLSSRQDLTALVLVARPPGLGIVAFLTPADTSGIAFSATRRPMTSGLRKADHAVPGSPSITALSPSASAIRRSATSVDPFRSLAD
jgi:phage terminase large subunit-like protein